MKLKWRCILQVYVQVWHMKLFPWSEDKTCFMWCFYFFFPVSFVYHLLCSVAQSCLTLCIPVDCSTPDFPLLHYLPEFAQTHVHRVSDAIQPFHSLLSPSSPALNLSQHQGLFQWVGFLHQVAKYWSFSFSISPSNEYSGWIYFRIDWFDLAVQGTLKYLL